MSRREQIRMTQKEIESYLRSHCRITIISNGSNGYPHPMPMNFVINPDGSIEMTTYKKSQKVHRQASIVDSLNMTLLALCLPVEHMPIHYHLWHF